MWRDGDAAAQKDCRTRLTGQVKTLYSAPLAADGLVLERGGKRIPINLTSRPRRGQRVHRATPSPHRHPALAAPPGRHGVRGRRGGLRDERAAWQRHAPPAPCGSAGWRGWQFPGQGRRIGALTLHSIHDVEARIPKGSGPFAFVLVSLRVCFGTTAGHASLGSAGTAGMCAGGTPCSVQRDRFSAGHRARAGAQPQ